MFSASIKFLIVLVPLKLSFTKTRGLKARRGFKLKNFGKQLCNNIIDF